MANRSGNDQRCSLEGFSESLFEDPSDAAGPAVFFDQTDFLEGELRAEFSDRFLVRVVFCAVDSLDDSVFEEDFQFGQVFSLEDG